MRKPILLLSLVAMFGMTATARSLNPSEALSRVTDRPVSRSVGGTVSTTPVLTVGSDDSPAIYVFNKPDRGWMIVAADDVAAPLLGYSDQGSFDPENMPDNLKSWLEMCSAQIRMASEAGAEAYNEYVSRAADREVIDPLVKTTWDQQSPYNYYCPDINNVRTVTGCVATAMAQVMKYYNWPDQVVENGDLTYTLQPSGPTYSADFSNFRFDWDNMLDSYPMIGYTNTQRDAVAKLMQACGYSVEMRYNISSAGGSGAINQYVGHALSKYFKYDQSLHNEPRDLYSAEQWEEMVYNNLTNFGPLVYWGTGSVSHCFVCDGYAGNSYFHFNWGWSGSFDGNFKLDALNPAGAGTGGGTGGYNFEQGALFGVKPAGATQGEIGYTFYATNVTKVTSQGTYLTIQGEFKNYSTSNVSGKPVFRVYSEDGSKFITSIDNFPTQPNLFSPFIIGDPKHSMSCSISSSYLGEGTYRIYPAIRIGDTEYEFKTAPSVPSYVIYTRKKNGNQYINTAELQPVGEKVVEDLSTNGNFYPYCKFKISGIAKFTGQATATLLVNPTLLDASGNVVYRTDGTTLTFTPEGNPFEFTSQWLNIEPGEYTFALSYVDANIGGYRHIATCQATVKEYESVKEAEVKNFIVEDQNAVNPNDIRMILTVTGTSGVDDDDVYFNIKKEDGTVVWTQTIRMLVSSGYTTEVKATASLAEAKPGEQYIAYVERYPIASWGKPKYTITDPVTFTIADLSGIADIEADNDAPVEYFNLSGLRVDAENLTPGIYIRRQGSKTVKVLVK